MSDITSQAVNAVIDAVDGAAASAITILGAAVEVAHTAAEAPVDVAGKTLGAVLEEASQLQSKLVSLLREAADAVTAPLP